MVNRLFTSNFDEMKKFVIVITLTLGVPILIILCLFLCTDPFRTLHEFDINDVDATNREYLSTELFLRNYTNYSYDSFVFASSRGGGINTYTWKTYIGEDTQPYLFQSWSETLTGVQLKINYLHENKIPIRNALLLIDIPGTFSKKQLPYESLSLKHYKFTDMPKWVYNCVHLFNFIQSPTLWIQSVKKTLRHQQYCFSSDTITNDYKVENYLYFATIPPQDSLKYCSDMTRQTFLAKITNKSVEDAQMSSPLINAKFKEQLRDIKSIFDLNCTDYHILITPRFCYTSEYINCQDLEILYDIFGSNRVHDYSAPNELNMDYNNFSDPAHFDLHTGFIILKEIYGDMGNIKNK